MTPPVRLDPAPALADLAAVAGHGFATTDEAVAAVLALIVEHVGLRSAFLTRITPGEDRNDVLAAYNAPGGCAIAAGAVLPLSGTF